MTKITLDVQKDDKSFSVNPIGYPTEILDLPYPKFVDWAKGSLIQSISDEKFSESMWTMLQIGHLWFCYQIYKQQVDNKSVDNTSVEKA